MSGGRPVRLIRWLLGLLGAGLLAGLALLAFAWWEARQPPTVREAYVPVPGWPAGEPSRTVLLISDTHVHAPEMPPERLAGIVRQLNEVKPDLVLLAGDFLSERQRAGQPYGAEQTVAALAGLRATFGVAAVLGNHDHWSDPAGFRRAFTAHGIPLLANRAIRRGPFIVGGVDDEYTHHDNLPATLRAMAALGPGVRLLFTHTPDVIPKLKEPVAAIFAGHTHCGQVSPPPIGPIVTMSRYGRRFACGEIHDAGKTIFVGAGVGTSGLPIRFGAPPDVWLVRFGPNRAAPHWRE